MLPFEGWEPPTAGAWPAKSIFTESGLRFLRGLARQISWFCRSLFLSVYPGSLSVVLCWPPSVFLFLCFLVYFEDSLVCFFQCAFTHRIHVPFHCCYNFHPLAWCFCPGHSFTLCGLKTCDFLVMPWKLSDAERDKQRSNLAWVSMIPGIFLSALLWSYRPSCVFGPVCIYSFGMPLRLNPCLIWCKFVPCY